MPNHFAEHGLDVFLQQLSNASVCLGFLSVQYAGKYANNHPYIDLYKFIVKKHSM